MAAISSLASSLKHGPAINLREDTPNRPSPSIHLTPLRWAPLKPPHSGVRSVIASTGTPCPSSNSLLRKAGIFTPLLKQTRRFVARRNVVKVSASAAGASPLDRNKERGGGWVEKLTGSHSPPASDIVWAFLGAFASMAALAQLDKHLVHRGFIPLTIGPTAAITAILTASPAAPVAARWNIVVAHMGAAVAGILALTLLGPGGMARAVAVASSVAFMQYTGSLHPPAAGIAMLFVDSASHQSLGWKYVLFPGLVAALVLVLVTEAVSFLRRSIRF